jgi:hypothetical protein
MVVMVAFDVGGDATVQRGRVGEVQRDEGEVAFLNVERERACVTGADNPGFIARAASRNKNLRKIEIK